jgi:hypothetical protein
MEWNNVEFHEQVNESPTFSFAPLGESRMEQRGWFDWGEVESQVASKAYLGYATLGNKWGANPVNYVSRSPSTNNTSVAPVTDTGKLPFVHPKWPNNFFICDGFGAVKGIVPQGVAADGTAEYEEALSGLSFRSPKGGYRILSDDDVVTAGGTPVAPTGAFTGPNAPGEFLLLRCCEVFEKATSKAQTFQGGAGGLKWKGDGVAVSAAAFVVLWETDITLIWYPVPLNCYNEAVMKSLVGKTNLTAFPISSAAFTSRMTQRPAKSLVWGTPDVEYIWMGNCEPALKITLHLKHHHAGANFLYRHNPPGAGVSPRYEEVERRVAATSAPLYEAAEFSLAFMPP